MTAAAPVRDDQRFPALDGLRAMGALAVLLTHVGFQSGASLSGPFAGLLARMDWGVALFFAISGFLLFRPYAVAHLDGTPRPRPGTYLWHRALRILPVLWLAVLASALLLPHPNRGPRAFLEHALLVQIYLPDNALEGLTQLWSLATEAAFYLVLPVLGWLATRHGSGRRWCRTVIGLCGVAVLAGPVWMGWCAATGSDRGHLWLPGFVGWFGIGIALAVWQVGRTRGVLEPGSADALAQRTGTVWALAGALFVLVSTPLAGPYDLTSPTAAESVVKNLGYAVIALLVVAPAVAPRTVPSAVVGALSSRPAHVLGSISYGVFAYHVVVLAVVGDRLGLRPFEGGFLPRLAWTLSLSLLLAAASFYLIERPLMRRGRRREPSAGYLVEPAAPAGVPVPTSPSPARARR